MKYAVTVEPGGCVAHPKAPRIKATIEADDKDEALDSAQAAYRRLYPHRGRLRVQVVWVREP
jgi:hypothetical protein